MYFAVSILMYLSNQFSAALCCLLPSTIQKYFSKGVIFRVCLRQSPKSWNQNQFCTSFDSGSSSGCKSHKGLISKIQLNRNCCNPTQVYNTTWANTNYANNFAVFYSQYIFNHITIKLFSSCTYHPVHIPFSAMLSFYSFTQWEKVILFS